MIDCDKLPTMNMQYHASAAVAENDNLSPSLNATSISRFQELLAGATSQGSSTTRPEILASKSIEKIIGAALRDPQLRTVMVLDPDGVTGSYGVFHEVPHQAVTVAVRPSWDHVHKTGRDTITVSTGGEPLTSALNQRGLLEPFSGNIDILFRYHDGIADRSAVRAADRLLSENGHYVEIFIQPDGSDQRIVTYHTREEVRNLAVQL